MESSPRTMQPAFGRVVWVQFETGVRTLQVEYIYCWIDRGVFGTGGILCLFSVCATTEC